MNVLSDSESSDSDTGRRFKTESTRTPRDKVSTKSRSDSLSGNYAHKRSRHYRSKSRSKSPSRNRSRSRDHYARKRSKSRERSHRKYDKYESAEKPSKRHNSKERKQNERDKDKDKDRDREKERDRSSYHSSSSKSNEKHRSKHKRPHSKPNTLDEKATSYKNKSPSNNTTAAIETTTEKHKKHKKEKDREKDKDKDKHRDERSNKPTDYYEHRHKSNEKQLATIDSSVQKRNVDIRMSPMESNGNANRAECVDESLICGPSLPPHMVKTDQKPTTEKTYGPSLPSDSIGDGNYSYVQPKNHLAGEEISESDDNELIGPVLDYISSKSEAYLELEKRALELKLAKLNECEQKDVGAVREREEWMTELPVLRKVADLGLTARQFRTKERDEIKDRSSWTETPRDREEKKKRKESTHDEVVKIRHQKSEKLYRDKRDAEQEDAVRKHKKKHKRDESLLEMHQKKMKKKTQEKSEPTERRPFSRDTDLQVNRFDEAQKKSVLKKAQLLDTRFNSGQSKYL